MAELKHLFSQGKMHKDLDERLVPNGQYRDALNVQVNTSENSEVGTIQNILGNTLRDTFTFANGTCIGTALDTKNDKIYWFVADDNGSYILEYDVATTTSSIVLADRNSILNFSTDFLITGANVLDKYLFFTDNNNEPKKVDIDTFKSFHTGSTNIAAHTEVYGRDFIEHDVTVIKLAPLTAPTMTMSSTKRSGTVTSRIDFGENGDSLFVDTASGGTGVAFLAGHEINIEYDSSGSLISNTGLQLLDDITGIEVGDTIIIETDDDTSSAATTSKKLRAIITDKTLTSLGSLISVRIQTIDPSLNNEFKTFTVTLEEEASFYQFRFPRFATRYKYTDGQYSPFSPFTLVAFLPTQFTPDQFKYSPREGYNLGMVNNLRKLDLTNIVPSTIPVDVVEIDILYKESNNTNVYVVDSIDSKDKAWDNNSYILEAKQIHQLVPSNQILRHYDNVPRKALAQEVTANRIVYGNYTHQYDLKTARRSGAQNILEDLALRYDVSIKSYGGEVATVPAKSIKSLRTYQVGVSYIDKYGRKTPVLTASGRGAPHDTQNVNKTVSTIIGKEYAKQYNDIAVKINSEAPTFATHYQYYIKETSNEYYNLALDRFYPAEDGNIWLSFPSSERNKVEVGSFIELKKQHDNDVAVEVDAKYKIIAIENEAPDFIKRKFQKQGHLTTEFTNVGFPLVDFITLRVPSGEWSNTSLVDVHEKPDLFCRISDESGSQTLRSDFFEIASITSVSGEYVIELEDPLNTSVSFTSTDGSYTNRNNQGTGFKFEVFQQIIKNEPEFVGRFFAKIYRDDILETHLLSTEITTERKVKHVIPLWGLVGYDSSSSNNFTGESVSTGSHDGNPATSIGPNDQNRADPARDFWEDKKKHDGLEWSETRPEWFIDYTRNPDQVSHGYEMHKVVLGSASGLGFYNRYKADNTNNNSDSSLTNINGDKYIHSYGVRTTSNVISISYSGIGEQEDNNEWDDVTKRNNTWGKFPLGYSDTEQYQGFVENLAPGTIFRFSNDRDTEYEIKQVDKVYILNYGVYEVQRMGKFKHQRRVMYNIHLKDPNTGLDKYPTFNMWDIPGLCDVSGNATKYIQFEILDIYQDEAKEFSSTNPAIFETEPKEDIGLELYYAASDHFPIIKQGLLVSGTGIPASTTVTATPDPLEKPFGITISNNTTAIVPVNTTLTLTSPDGLYSFTVQTSSYPFGQSGGTLYSANSGTAIIPINGQYTPSGQTALYGSIEIDSTKYSYQTNPTNALNWHGMSNALSWFNCYSFANGVESNRIRDDFNAVQIDKGPIVSTTFAEQYKEENRANGLIYSGIYNSTSGVNNLNQFIQGEKITKDIHPLYGSIQKLHTRDTNLVTFCEDKVVRILADKDALFNADGSPQLISSNNVLGEATPFAGEFGISTNPESFASYGFRAYFTDKNRGTVLRLSQDGLTPISMYGMSDYFNDNLAAATTAIGSYDDDSGAYILSLNNDTVTFKEDVLGWPSRMSFIPEAGTSLNNIYYSFSGGKIYSHDNNSRNTFYGATGAVASTVELIFNEGPSKIKNFKTLFYEGSEGWTAPTIETDQQSGQVLTWDIKEGIYYNWIKGLESTWNNTTQAGTLDTQEFSVQGIDNVTAVVASADYSPTFNITITENQD